MFKKIFHTQAEYFVYITLDKNKNAHIKISDNERFVFKEQMEIFAKIVYFEKFLERTKALRKKRYLNKLGEKEKLRIIKKKNPELLNLIFTIFDNCETRDLPAAGKRKDARRET